LLLELRHLRVVFLELGFGSCRSQVGFGSRSSIELCLLILKITDVVLLELVTEIIKRLLLVILASRLVLPNCCIVLVLDSNQGLLLLGVEFRLLFLKCNILTLFQSLLLFFESGGAPFAMPLPSGCLR
jgi:hypothetical protein